MDLRLIEKLPGIASRATNSREVLKLLIKNALGFTLRHLSPHHIIEAHIMPAIVGILPNSVLDGIVSVCWIKKFRLWNILLNRITTLKGC